MSSENRATAVTLTPPTASAVRLTDSCRCSVNRPGPGATAAVVPRTDTRGMGPPDVRTLRTAT
jgi:hypothetical protein